MREAMARTTELQLSPNQNRTKMPETLHTSSYMYALSIAFIKHTCYKFRFLARSDFHVHAEMQKAWNSAIIRHISCKICTLD